MEGRRSLSTARTPSLGSNITMKNQQKRSLQVAWKSVDLEREHFLKLMALNEKILRSKQERRQEHIAHLKSHLTMPQIVEIEKAGRRSQERQHDAHEVNIEIISGNVSGDEGEDDNASNNPQKDMTIEYSLSNVGKSRSFYGHNRSSGGHTGRGGLNDTSNSGSKHDSLEAKMERNSQSAPKSRVKSDDMHTGSRLNRTYPSLTTNVLKPVRSASTPRRASTYSGLVSNSSLSKTSSTSLRGRSFSSMSMRSSFSCHEERKKEAGRRRSHSDVGSPSSSPTRTTNTASSAKSTDSVFHEAIDALHHETTRVDLRNLMVIENDLQFMHLQRRKEALFIDIEQMVKRDREFSQRHLLFPTTEETDTKQLSLSMMSQKELMESMATGKADVSELRKEIRRRKVERMRDRMRAEVPADELKRREGETDDEYQARVEKWRRDIKKVRYLRRTTTRNDLSDVVTLAMEQQKNNKIWMQSLRDNLF